MAMLLKKLWRGRRAASLVEFAIILPLILLLAGGLWEFGHVYDAYLVATNAAREGARWAALGYDDASVQGRVEAYLLTGYAGRVASGELTPGIVGIQLLPDPIDPANPPGSPGAPVKVTVPVAVAIYFPGILSLGSTLDLTGDATMRLETTAGSGALPPPPECPSVAISGVAFSPIGNSGKVDVSWTTNVAANSRIEWGTTPSYGSSAANGSAVTSHSLQMSGIAASTLYYYSISSVSACGPGATSAGTYTR